VSFQLPALPQGIGGITATQLVLAINDRLRRIALAIGGGGEGTAPANAAVIYGTHAERVSRPVPSEAGMLFIETDRGNVMYQNQGGAWRYLSGTMLGTLTPDYRPADLGPNDVGFDFVATDQQREFFWSGSVWKETTPANDVQIAPGTGTLTMTTTLQDMAGCTLTLAMAGRYLITGVFGFQTLGAGDAGQVLKGGLMTDGTAQSSQAFVIGGTANDGATAALQWLYAAPAAGKTVKLQAGKSGGTGTSVVYNANSMISAVWISP
jgi:hypothetical protein